RLFFVGARGGHLPDAMALINIHTFTPVPAVIVLAVISITMLFLGDVYTLINYVTFVESLCFAVCVCVLLYFRWRKPNVHRPIKVPIVIPVIFLIVCVFLLILPIYTSPQEVGMAIVLLLSGVPIYLIGIVWSNKPDVYKRNLAAFTKFVQKITFSCEQEV
ncbi:Asc-type amino acid transporter 1, partial [Lamellibrachia satsuma]